LFTIIIPTHERPLLLRRALQSLIAQTYKDFQVIVVDDTGAYIPPFPELAELHVMFLDDDDTFEPGHLQALASHIGTRTPEIVHCDFRVLREDRRHNPPQFLGGDDMSTAGITADSIFILNRIPNNCLVYRRDVVQNVRHAGDMRIYEDWDFLLACLAGRTLEHVATNGVNIYKSTADSPENERRGNTRDDLLVPTMLYLYKKHPAPNMATRLGRQELMAHAGHPVTLEQC
jgi:glycosyltransferase involved in cell wall biosynthesis